MARKAPSSTKGRTARKSSSTLSDPEQGAVIRPRRGRVSKSDDAMPAEPFLASAIAPDTEKLTRPAKDDKAPASKARRGRKPQVSSASEPTLDDANAGSMSDDLTAQTGDLVHAAPQADQPTRTPEAAAELVSAAGAGATAAAPPAAHWDAATGAAHFDWPAIEQVAGTEGPNQAMAKLLLAARAEGANSRWPF